MPKHIPEGNFKIVLEHNYKALKGLVVLIAGLQYAGASLAERNWGLSISGSFQLPEVGGFLSCKHTSQRLARWKTQKAET